ncbi:MAG: alpha-methylacyl-CoA racemase [Mycobacterium sp.]|nr:alpha-methylacyl-CoA racemase [Mycobacterium sp.]
MTTGPLSGVKVLEIASIGPGPFCGILLADLGADVVRVDRPGGGGITLVPRAEDLFNRGKRSIAVDLSQPGGAETVLSLVDHADILFVPARGGRAAGHRSGSVSGTTAANRLRTDDRMGSGRAARLDRGTRHHLHRNHRRPPRDRPSRWFPADPAQPLGVTSQAEVSTCWSDCSPHSTRHDEAAAAKSSILPSSTAPPT